MITDPAAHEYGRNASITQLGRMAWTCYQELRVKRDAIALMHKKLRQKSDDVQKLVMGLGMFTAAFESCRVNFSDAFSWSNRADAILLLIPISTSTAVAALTAAQRYWRYAERLEMLAQTRSDAQCVINSLREFMQENRVQSMPVVEARCEFRVIAVQYNRALDNIETLTYPDDRRAAFSRAFRFLHPRRTRAPSGREPYENDNEIEMGMPPPHTGARDGGGGDDGGGDGGAHPGASDRDDGDENEKTHDADDVALSV